MKLQLHGRAFTLAELIIGIVIIAAIFMAINSFHSSQLKLFSKRIAKIQLEDDLSVAMMQIEKELITAKNVVYPVVSTGYASYVELNQNVNNSVVRRIRWEINKYGELMFWPDYDVDPGNYEVICKLLDTQTSGFLWNKYASGKEILCVRLIGQTRYHDVIQRISCFSLGDNY